MVLSTGDHWVWVGAGLGMWSVNVGRGSLHRDGMGIM
jgi:hypothetical protein